MVKRLIRIGVLIVTFFVALFGIGFFYNRESSGLTEQMGKATLPVVRAVVEGQQVNVMRGYKSGMEAQTMRDTVTPLKEDRSLSIVIEKLEQEVKEISYKIRSLDASNLIEDTKVSDFKEDAKEIKATLDIKNLLDEDTEYVLIISLTLESGEAYDYFTRIIYNEDLHTKEKIEFVQNFHNLTFKKEDAKSIVKNLESNSSGDNQHFQKVNIHSSFDAVTFGDLQIQVVGKEEYSIIDQDEEVGIILVDYIAQAQNSAGETENYKVQEYYRVRYTSQRMYLLDFERTMDQYFQPDNQVFYDKSIELGVVSEDTAYATNEKGNQIAFVTGGELWSYDQENGRLYSVFSFLSQNYTDVRTNEHDHDVKILSVAENGDMDFLVYGYMSRGVHEGEVGIAVYRFAKEKNCIEEVCFIVSTESMHFLQEDVGQIAYINESSELFLMLEGTIYNINLTTKEYTLIAQGLGEGNFAISESGSKIAWQEGNKLYDSYQINIMDLTTKEQSLLEVSQEERIRPVGFLKEDFIYGVARVSDIQAGSAAGIFPMYKICVLDEKNQLEREYAPAGIFVTEASVAGNVINMERVKVGDSGFEETTPDHMVNNQVEETKPVILKTTKTDLKKTQVQLSLTKEIAERNPKLLTPKQVIYEESREIALERTKDSMRFYVFAKGKILGTYSNVLEAIEGADENAGVVLNNRMNYVWERANRKTKVKLMEIGTASMGSGTNSLSIAINTIFQIEGKSGVDAESLLQSGMSIVDVLEEGLETAQVYNLSGGALNTALYYVNRGYPVLAKMSEDKMCLIVGYDKYNTILMDSTMGEVYYYGINDSTKMFEEAGNVFYAYMPNQKVAETAE